MRVETPPTSSDTSREFLLQWSHAHVRVETHVYVGTIFQENVLQWSHAHVRVETKLGGSYATS